MLLLDLWRFFTGRVADDELVMIQESEDAAALHLPPRTGRHRPRPTDRGTHHDSRCLPRFAAAGDGDRDSRSRSRCWRAVSR
jgi:hypothetical protein